MLSFFFHPIHMCALYDIFSDYMTYIYFLLFQKIPGVVDYEAGM